MKNLNGLLRIGLLVLLITSCIAVVSASAKSTNSCGGTVYIGQTYDVSKCVSPDTKIGWWFSGADVYTTAFSQSYTFTDPASFNVDPTFYVYAGTWYIVDPLTGFAANKAFKVAEPKT